MAELVDAADSKSAVRKGVKVRFLSWAQTGDKGNLAKDCLFYFSLRPLTVAELSQKPHSPFGFELGYFSLNTECPQEKANTVTVAYLYSLMKSITGLYSVRFPIFSRFELEKLFILHSLSSNAISF